ncbi:MAG: ABC transporter permease [Chloroflexaceae bacterium]|nr:ABC transporter permease [Chloroflexaceae bacterium]
MFRHIALALLLFLLLLISLQWLIPALGIPFYILPTPSSVFERLLNPDLQESMLPHAGSTALAGMGGFLIGSTVGFGLALIFVHVPLIEQTFSPWVVALQTVPLVAIAPLLLLWFGNGLLTRMIMAALFTVFPVLVNAVRGLRQANPATQDLLQSYAISNWQRFWVLRLPNSLPYLFTGLKIGSTLAILGAIVAEFEGADQGLGFVITISTYYLDTPRTFAAITLASLLSLSLYLLLTGLERWIIFWPEPA